MNKKYQVPIILLGVLTFPIWIVLYLSILFCIRVFCLLYKITGDTFFGKNENFSLRNRKIVVLRKKLEIKSWQDLRKKSEKTNGIPYC